MATYTDNYNLTKPTFAESADIRTINGNMDTIDAVMHASQVSLADAYDETRTSSNPYNTGDIVMYEFLMYKCLEDGVYGTWDGTKWERTTAGANGGGGDASEISYDNTTSGLTADDVQEAIDELEGNIEDVSDGLDYAVESLAPAFDPTETYNEGDIVSKDNKLYQCNTDNTTGDWDSTKWDEYIVSEHMGEGGSTVTITPETIAEPKQKIADFEIDGASGSLYAPIVEIEGHASGAVASFSDGSANPIKSIDIGIVPLQSGSGDPSPQNVRPIVGKNAINVLNLDLPNGNYMASDRQISFAWEDGDTEYDMPFNVMANETVKDSSDNDVDVLTLESKYVLPFDIVYDAPEAIYASANDLPAGDYYFKIVNDSWGGNNDKYVSFTIDTILTAGKQIRKSSGAYNVSIEDCTLAIYDSGASTSGTALDFTVSTTQPSSGTDLGQTDGTADLNYWHCVILGYNRWKYSAIRQFLNSDQAKGNWWVQQHKWDVMPSYATTADGFLKGMDPAVLAHIKTTEVKTARNTVFNSGDTPLGGFDTTFDKIFLAALEQMYIQPQESGEGTYWPYYKELLNVNSPVARGATYPELKKYDIGAKTTSRTRWLRSCYRGYAGAAWCAASSGSVNYSGANGAFRCAPCLRIGVNKKDTVNLGNTYYGGKLDVTSGVLTVDRLFTKFKDVTWTYQSSGTRFYTDSLANTIKKPERNTDVVDGFICSVAKTLAVNSVFVTDQSIGVATSGNVFYKNTNYTTKEAMIEDLGNETIVYPLTTPLTVQLTPTQITSLLGDNNIWSDTGEILECVYQRDINLVINQFDARITALEQALNSSGTRSLSLSKSAVNEEETNEEITEEPKEEEQNEDKR